ncbi:hypothetical protein DL98DRAFT_656912 [Cadophora sp. DSE1049]|nr:hypothetical protein DL98DRAFT_656912 [Cadophora sp. DSE1049]
MTWIRYRLATVLVYLATFLHPTTAVECGIGGTYPMFASQEELDSVVANCTVWVGSISVASDWNGTLVLNNIINVTGLFTTEPLGGSAYWPSPFLTSIEAPELRYLGGMNIGNASNVSIISLPRLEQIDFLSVDQSVENEVVLSFPSLVNVTDRLEMLGNLPMVSFPSLVEAASIYIANNRSLLWDYSLDTSRSYSGITVDFPVLVQSGLIQMNGNISSIEMPLLVSSSGGYDRYGSSDGWFLKIWTSGNPLDIKFPSLWNVSDIFLAGNVRSFSFPALESLNGTFKFRPSTNATFDPRPLQRAVEIDVSGTVTSYNLDSLTYVDKLIIEPEQIIDCDPAAEVWKRMHPGYDENGGGYGRTPSNYYYSCNGPAKKEKKPFPKVAVGLSVGIGIPVWFFFMFALWHSRKEKKKAEEIAKIPPPDYEAEMAARSAGGGEVLPDYEPRRSQGSGGHPGSVIELVDMTRPSPYPTHPPGYGDAVDDGSVSGATAGGSGEVRNGRTVGDGEPRSGAGT